MPPEKSTRNRLKGNTFRIPDRPVWFHFSLTNRCNLSCPFCWRHKKNIKKANFEHAPDEIIDVWLSMLSPKIEVIHPGGGGEPMLHPRFGEFVEKALELQDSNPARDPEIRLVTNGTLIGRWPIVLEAFRRGRIQMVISMESANQEKYRFFRRGGNLSVVEKNLQQIKKARDERGNFKPNTVITISAVLTKHNVEDVHDLLQFASVLGVDKLSLKRLETNENSPEFFRREDAEISDGQVGFLQEVAESNTDIGIEMFFFGLPKINQNRPMKQRRVPCEDIFRSIRFHPDGGVYTCCLVRTKEANVGDFRKQTLDEMWLSPKLTNARMAILSGNPSSMCKGCPHVTMIEDFAPYLRTKYLQT